MDKEPRGLGTDDLSLEPLADGVFNINPLGGGKVPLRAEGGTDFWLGNAERQNFLQLREVLLHQFHQLRLLVAVACGVYPVYKLSSRQRQYFVQRAGTSSCSVFSPRRPFLPVVSRVVPEPNACCISRCMILKPGSAAPSAAPVSGFGLEPASPSPGAPDAAAAAAAADKKVGLVMAENWNISGIAANSPAPSAPSGTCCSVPPVAVAVEAGWGRLVTRCRT